MSADLKIPDVIWCVVGTDEQNHWTHATTDRENAKSIAEEESSRHSGDLRAVRYRRDVEADAVGEAFGDRPNVMEGL